MYYSTIVHGIKVYRLLCSCEAWESNDTPQRVPAPGKHIRRPQYFQFTTWMLLSGCFSCRAIRLIEEDK